MELLELKFQGLLPRKVAWEILQAVAAGAYADVALERKLQKYSLKTADRALVKEISFGAIRNRQILDSWVDYLAKVPSIKQPPLLRWLFHVGLYQIFYMDRIPAAAAVNTSVELAKSGKLSRLAPVVNGVLRAALRAKASGVNLPISTNDVEGLSQKHSMPVWLVEKFIHWRGIDGAEDIASASNEVPPIDLRVNRLKSNPRTLMEKFEAVGLGCNFIEGCPYGLRIDSGSGDIRQWPGYKEGFWCVQDSCSQWIVPLLTPKPGECVLDACSAPGGKTTQLAELMDDKGELWAVDRSSERLTRVTENAKRLALTSVRTLAVDAMLLHQIRTSPTSFDKILLDVPCSGLGTLARHPDARWRITPKQIKELVILQANLLESLLSLLKPGGRMVYSTCTINPDENSGQIQAFLRRHGNLRLHYERQTWPNTKKPGDGFYAAVMDLG